MAKHGMPQVGALALDHVKHPMGKTLPARQVDRERRTAHFGRARGALQHLVLGRRDVLANADLADDPSANFGIVFRDAAVACDGLGDRLHGHIPEVRRMRGLKIKARAHHDIEARAPADTLQRRRVAADADVRRVDDGPAAVFDKMREFLDRGFHVEEVRNCRG